MNLNPATLILVLQKLVELYDKLLKLAELQHVHVAGEQTDELLEVLQLREQVVTQITGIESKLKAVRQQWPTISAGFPEADRALAESLFGQTRELLERVTAADQDDALLLQQRKLSVGRQLTQARDGRRVNQNYAASAYAGASGNTDVAR